MLITPPSFRKAACACIRNLAPRTYLPCHGLGDCTTRFITPFDSPPPRLRDPNFSISVFNGARPLSYGGARLSLEFLSCQCSWCRREDSNLHAFTGDCPSDRCVSHFATAAYSVLKLVPLGGLEPPKLLVLSEATLPICPEGGKRKRPTEFSSVGLSPGLGQDKSLDTGERSTKEAGKQRST